LLTSSAFLLITHEGRKSGERRETVAMALTCDPATRETTVFSVWGRNTDWIRNILAQPALEIEIGRESYTPEQRFLSEDESVDVVLEFRRRHPWRTRLASPILGRGYLGSHVAIRNFVRDRPFVSFPPPGVRDCPQRVARSCRCRLRLGRRSCTQIMSLTAKARSIPGTLRQEVVIGGMHRLITDEPKRLGGDGSAPAPHELLPAALAACISTTLAMYARTKNWELGEVTVAVDYDNKSTPRRFDVAVELGGDLSDEQLERLEKVAAACPVRRSIEAGIEFVETVMPREGRRVTTAGAA
jgi:putative redox protein